ncbi:hypothetical protein SARC_01937 [Sphaeroforma arctica JP610]|uniref:Uncharacterized protein n=1 Tax=Sphaeroforma arctica JP610 TaxID=667725 RepID=A0A0L0GAG5_9EUKA|nr:hypothetical protein SARC_01937 [Sphaeroforma arctica JP610]KNC85899.1 hypothetical protein SARC_01937 [Sphaeroforma arctica JP610]|eukprot:XP_014159801.1 hypothetical protein SARC_01937 [Sphaeroforma arctica JP610]
MIKVGRIDEHPSEDVDQEAIIDHEIQKQHKLCTKSFHVKYIRRTKQRVKLTDDAVPMTEQEYRANVARERLAYEALEQQRLVNEMVQLGLLQENCRPTLRSGRRPLSTIQPDDNPKTVKKRHTKVDSTTIQLEVKTVALTKGSSRLAALEEKMAQLHSDIKSAEENLTQQKIEHNIELNLMEDELNNKQHRLDGMAKNFKETRISKLTYEYISQDVERVRFCTGFQTPTKFVAFAENIEKYGKAFTPGRSSLTIQNAL